MEVQGEGEGGGVSGRGESAVVNASTGQATPLRGRIAALDQFRGYTVLGMLLVNFVGRFEATPGWLKHHTVNCCYADTIMPQFFFAVGFAYRLTFLRRLRDPGAGASLAFGHAIRRNLGLILLGVVFYHLDGTYLHWSDLQRIGLVGVLRASFQRDPIQTLTHIGFTSLWVLPVIARSVRARLVWTLMSAVLHLVLSSWFYAEFAWTRPVIDGGLLGFLTWTIPLLAGSLAYDALAARGASRSIAPLLFWAVVLALAGYALAWLGGGGGGENSSPGQVFAPGQPWIPFATPVRPVHINIWMMSQRSGSATYLIFATGVSLAVLAVFVALADVAGVQIGVFRTFGGNALAAYLVHGIVSGAISPFAPRDAPGWYAAAATAVYLGINWLFIRHLERTGVALKM